MSKKHDLDRRKFLADMSKGLGLISASNLFNQISFAQSSQKIERVIHIFFQHGILSKNRGERSEFYIANNTTLDGLMPYTNRCRFIRHIDYAFKRVNGDSVGGQSENSHSLGQSSVFTGCAAQTGHGKTDNLGQKDTGVYGGKSVDILAGEYLQKRYSTEVPFLLLGNTNNQDGKSNGSPFLWLTSSWERNRKPRNPEMNLVQVKSLMDKYKNNGLSCKNENPITDVGDAKKEIENDIARLEYLQNNMKFYNSKYLMPKEEMEKLEKQISRKIASRKEFLNNGTTGTNPIEDCGNVPSTPGNMNKALGKGAEWKGNRTVDNGYNERSDKIFDLMMFAFRSNYTRSVTYYPGDFYKQAHGAGHDKDYDKHHGYERHLFNSVARLLKKLSDNNMLDSTLVVMAGEFGNHLFGNHPGYNSPWMIVNGGRSGEYSNGKVHPGDVACSTMQKLGDTSVTSFGCKRHNTNRAGRFNPNLI